VGGTCPNTCGDNTPYCSSDNVTCVECLEDNHCGDSERCKDGNCLLIEEEQLRNSDDQQDEEADDDEEDEELPSQYQQPDYISVDINKDGMVNLFDYEIFVEDFRNYRENGVVAERSDLDRDGDIDLSDYALFIDMYAQSRDS
jgi:cobalamin biosynthesis protein CobT